MTPRRKKPLQRTPTVHPKRLRQLLRRMVEIYSPFGKEADVVDFVHDYLLSAGLPVIRQSVDEERDNLIVMPPGVEAELVLVGHLDTVEAYDLEQFVVEEQGDEIVGLGTADMKGGCAAMIEAYHCLWEAGFDNLPVALALVVGEEESGDGSARLVEDYFSFSSAIVGEPTDLQPCLSHYGYLEVNLQTRGRRMHASMAPLAENAIASMLQLLLRFTEHFETKRTDVIYNIRELESLKAGFAVPDRCEAWVDLHVPPLSPLGEIRLELEEIVARERANRAALEAMIHFNTIDAGYSIPPKGSLYEVLRAAFAKYEMPFEPQAFPSHSDANQLWQAGIRPVLLGPGRLEKAHTEDESVPFAQVLRAAQLYTDIAMAFVPQQVVP